MTENIPVRNNNQTSNTPTQSGSVYFEKDSINITVANASSDEAKRFANMIYQEITRKQELESMKNYRTIDRRNQGAR